MDKSDLKKFVYLDIETTGLNPSYDRIIEIACACDKGTFEEVIRLHTFPPMDPFVVEMHTKTGLLSEVMERGASLGAVEEQLMRQLKSWGFRPGQPIMAGKSIYFDRSFIARWMPDLHAFFHWRMFDVSAVRQFLEIAEDGEWKPKAQEGTKHRALADAIDSKAMLDQAIDYVRAK